jgi:hypothetical protein
LRKHPLLRVYEVVFFCFLFFSKFSLQCVQYIVLLPVLIKEPNVINERKKKFQSPNQPLKHTSTVYLSVPSTRTVLVVLHYSIVSENCDFPINWDSQLRYLHKQNHLISFFHFLPIAYTISRSVPACSIVVK